jgi:hypothetical protein
MPWQALNERRTVRGFISTLDVGFYNAFRFKIYDLYIKAHGTTGIANASGLDLRPDPLYTCE